MATMYDNAIQQLYVAYFNRPADPAGLEFWATVMAANGGDTSVISAEFAKSAEYTTEYDQLTTSGVVTQVYQNLFGHAPDSAGLAFWVNALNSRAMTVDTMVTEIAKGAQGTDKVAFESKVVVATAFTAAVDTPVEIAAYNTEEAQAYAKGLLAGIKTAAQATAAIVPATLDASVAAAVKAGTPFTLESGLAALGASKAAVADFLEAFDDDVDGDGDVDRADVAEAVADAEDAIELLVADADYDTATNAGVKAALLAEQVEIYADVLVAAQEALAEEQEALDEVEGLGDALAGAIAAEEAAEEAAEAETEAQAAFNSATSSFSTFNAGVTITGTLAAGTLQVTNADAEVIVSMEDGEVVIADDVDAADYRGLSTMVTAANAYLAAMADTELADEAVVFANLQVELLDLTSAATLAGAFNFTETTPEDVNAPTYGEILDELSALTSEALAARAAADAAPADVALDAAADAAEAAVAAFETDITDFIAANTTPLAAAVEAANDAVELAQESVDDLAEAIADLDAAQATADELEALEDAVEAAEDEFTANDFTAPKMLAASAFGTSGSDIFVFNDVNSTITSFGRTGTDVLYVGEGFTLNTGDVDDGVNATMEVFFTQSGNNTIVTIETEAYGSDSGDVQTITLTGVDAADLTFTNGIITI